MLDLTRVALTVALGIYDVDPAAVIQQGMGVGLDSLGRVVVAATGTAFRGVAKWNKASTLTGVITAERVVLTAVDVKSLKHPNVSNVLVTNLTGTPYVVTTDYVIDSAPNGTLHRVALGGIAAGETVLVSYTYELAAADLALLGANYMNSLDDSQGSGKLTMIQDFALIYTDQYKTDDAWAIDSVVSVAAGIFIVKGGGDVAISAKVVKLPSASDPFLGLQIG